MDGRGLQVPRPDGRLHSARPAARASAASSIHCDITYGTNAEFGFDYLRDNGMATAQGGAGPARPLLRHRGRSGLDPDRRGAHAAHHQRPGRRSRTTQQYRPISSRWSSSSCTARRNDAVQPLPRPRPRTLIRSCVRKTVESGEPRGDGEASRPALFQVKIGQPATSGC